MSEEFKNKNDYTCSAYMGSNKVNTMIYVHSVYAYTKYLEKNNIEWSVINIYSRRSKRFISRQYKSDFVIDRPK